MKRKVLIIVENSPVPADTRVRNEAHALARNGYDVTVLCPRRQGCRKGYEVIDGVSIYRHPMIEGGNSALQYLLEYTCALFWEVLYAWWIYMRRGFHVIQGCNPPDTIFFVALPFKLFGVKYIFDHHDANPELYFAKFGRKGAFYKIQEHLEKLTFRFSDVVISTNNSYKDLAVLRGGRNPADVFVVRNGPELSTFKAVPPKPALKYGKPYLVGYVGIMGFQDGLDLLLDVVSHIKYMGRDDMHFTCVGSGPALAELRKTVEDRDLKDMVNFTGRIPDKELLDILSTADVCVNPDRPCKMNDISTMIKIMEYMALEKPIVQFSSKEGRFSAMESSLYADTENQVPDFAAKLLWLLDHPAERARMGEFGRSRVESELAWQYSVANLLGAYERAFSKRELGSVQSESGGLRAISDYYRCPEDSVRLVMQPGRSKTPGFFQFGSGATCYGRVSGAIPAGRVTRDLRDVSSEAIITRDGLALPFDLAEVVNNLRLEYYRENKDGRTSIANRTLKRAYYLLRPFSPSFIRSTIQRIYYSRWHRIPFPRWPVDFSVDQVFQKVLTLALQVEPSGAIPFIWFWPDGIPSCAVMTHDVEDVKGRDFCTHLMDLDDSFHIKSAFEIIPECRYQVTDSFLNSIRSRGFEVNVHDLNHDGFLFHDRKTFFRRVEKINQYIRNYGASGFRAGAMYRHTAWYDALNVSYDMSVPNVAHMEPQRGGCCTVMPYFIGDVLELPLTATQDFALIYVLRNYTCELWKREIEMISAQHGLISFIVHPDYLLSSEAQRTYTELLAHLSALRSEGKLWIPLPREVNDWWRQRAQMRLVRRGAGWTIEGPGKERARVAYARLVEGRLSYEVESHSGVWEGLALG